MGDGFSTTTSESDALLSEQRMRAPYEIDHPQPPNFRFHVFEKSFSVDCSIEAVWSWLNTPETFTRGQIFPFRVEFVSRDGNAAGGFRVGDVCSHHGPLLNFPGRITAMEEPHYRDLQYFYGSHAVSFRVIRPRRLEFWLERASENQTKVILRVESFTKGVFYPLWTFAQLSFWHFFPRTLCSGARKVEAEREMMSARV